VGSRIVAGAAAALSLGVGVASAGVSPDRLVASALAHARAQRSVHYVAAQTLPAVAVTIVGDAAADRGAQHITYRKAGRAGHVTVLVVADTAYVRGDEFTLANYMGIPPASAAAWSGKWLSLSSSAPDYKSVEEAVRLGSTIDELRMPSPLRLAATVTRGGRRLVGVESTFSRGGRAVRETLYIDEARSLPVEQVGRSGTTTARTTLSRWNEPVPVVPPAAAIPIR
jgi:hypothetical protein